MFSAHRHIRLRNAFLCLLALSTYYELCGGAVSPHAEHRLANWQGRGECVPFVLPAPGGEGSHLTVHSSTAADPMHLHPHARGNSSTGIVCAPAGLRDVESWVHGSTKAAGKDLRVLSREQLDRAVTAGGAGGRFGEFVHKLSRGDPVHVAVLGGSITMGEGSEGASREAPGREEEQDPAGQLPRKGEYSWGRLLFHWLNATFPNPGHKFTNAAVSASKSTYMELCLAAHLDTHDVDLVIVEYAVNDGSAQAWKPRSIERLIRKLLELPHQPAVVLLNMWNYRCQEVGRCRGQWSQGEETRILDSEYGVLGAYYDLPVLSFWAATWREAVLLKQTGFLIPDKGVPEAEWREERYFMLADRAHPNPRGHRMAAQLAVHLLQRCLTALVLAPHRPPHSPRPAPLPPPYLEGNHAIRSKGCFFGQQLAEVVTEGGGWAMADEAPRFNGTKWGLLSTRIGDRLHLHLPTALQPDQDSSQGEDEGGVKVSLGILRSYEKMGMANLACLGCKCTCVSDQCRGLSATDHEMIMVNGLWGQRSTQTDIFNFEVSRGAACTLQLLNTQVEPVPYPKMKVMSLMLSETDYMDRSHIGHQGL